MFFRTFITLQLILLPAVLNASEFVLDEAMKAYKTNNYELASRILLADYGHLDNMSVEEKLKSAIIFYKNLQVYREIYEKLLQTQLSYLSILNRTHGSDYVKLYLAEIVYLLGDYKKSLTYYQRINQKNIVDETEHLHYQVLGAQIHYRNDNINEFQELRTSIKNHATYNNLALAYIDEKLNLSKKVKLAEPGFAHIETMVSTHEQQDRINNILLLLYTAKNSLIEATKLITEIDKTEPVFIEKKGTTKIIRFYDPSLVSSLSLYYYKMSQRLLNQVAKNAQYKDTAIYYLSELDILLGITENANKYKNSLKNLSRLPKTLSVLRDIRAAAHSYLSGEHNRAYQSLENSVNNLQNNPTLSAEAVLMCLYLGANCPTIVQQARLMAESGKSSSYSQLSLNVGRYLLAKNETEKAYRLIDDALQKSENSNLYGNNPILLINLAEVKRLNKDYSDSLQIFFSVAKNYPVMRQIQDAVQGEYLYQQRSSGVPTLF